MAATHRFEGALSWRAGGTGIATGNHTVTFDGAHEVCFIANSVSSSVTVEPEVVTDA